MKRNYVQVAQFLQERFPDIEVFGEIYPPSPISIFLLQLLSILQLFGIAWMIMGGDKVLRILRIVRTNQPIVPSWYYTIQENGAPIAIFLFLLAPNIIQNIGNTKGAFEIYYNDTIIFSKLQTGSLPSIDQLTRPLIDAGLQMIATKQN